METNNSLVTKTSLFVFNRRKKLIQVLNNLRVNEFNEKQILNQNTLIKDHTLKYTNQSTLRP